MLKYLLTGEMTCQEIRIKLSLPCRPVWTMDPAGPVLLIEVGEERPEEGHGANLVCTKLFLLQRMWPHFLWCTEQYRPSQVLQDVKVGFLRWKHLPQWSWRPAGQSVVLSVQN